MPAGVLSANCHYRKLTELLCDASNHESTRAFSTLITETCGSERAVKVMEGNFACSRNTDCTVFSLVCVEDVLGHFNIEPERRASMCWTLRSIYQTHEVRFLQAEPAQLAIPGRYGTSRPGLLHPAFLNLFTDIAMHIKHEASDKKYELQAEKKPFLDAARVAGDWEAAVDGLHMSCFRSIQHDLNSLRSSIDNIRRDAAAVPASETAVLQRMAEWSEQFKKQTQDAVERLRKEYDISTRELKEVSARDRQIVNYQTTNTARIVETTASYLENVGRRVDKVETWLATVAASWKPPTAAPPAFARPVLHRLTVRNGESLASALERQPTPAGFCPWMPPPQGAQEDAAGAKKDAAGAKRPGSEPKPPRAKSARIAKREEQAASAATAPFIRPPPAHTAYPRVVGWIKQFVTRYDDAPQQQKDDIIKILRENIIPMLDDQLVVTREEIIDVVTAHCVGKPCIWFIEMLTDMQKRAGTGKNDSSKKDSTEILDLADQIMHHAFPKHNHQREIGRITSVNGYSIYYYGFRVKGKKD